MRRDRLPRLVRAALAATLATFVALFGHVAAGGEMPHVLGLAVPLLFSLAAGVLLVGRRLSLPRLSVLVVLSQALFHALFVLGSSSAGVVSSGTGALHDHSVPTILVGELTPVSADALMLLGHLVGALVTVAALALGERAVLALARLARRAAERLLRAPLFVIRARREPVSPIDLIDGARVASTLLDCAPRRGPPAALAL